MTADESKNNEYIPVAYTFNDRYTSLALTSMVSIAENTKANIDFIIIHSGITEKYMEYIEGIKKYPHCKTTYKKIDEKIFIDAGALEKLPHYPVEVYYKMIIPDLVPNYDKVIFLDSDTLCLGDIKELFDIDISNVSMAAVQDVWFPEGRKELPLKSKCYFNCGTMMFNCKKMREADFCNNALKSLNGNPLMKSCSEEGILNYMLDEDKIALPLRFNYLEPWWNNWINYTGDKLTEYNEVKKNPTIIHYTGFKPNHIHSLHSLREKWWYYAQKTPCYKEILENFKKDVNAYVNKMQSEIGNFKKTLNEIKEKTAPYA